MTYFQLFAIPVFLFTLYLATDENGVGILGVSQMNLKSFFPHLQEFYYH